MTTILLIIIYLAFISLGLPDSLLGTNWPAIRAEWGLPLDAAGIISVIATASGVLSSLMSTKIIKKIGTGGVVFISCLLTGIGIVGISVAPSFGWVIFLAIPLGLGAGAVDASLNHYVAANFEARHMNWLHSFWGVGATLGPMIVASVLATGASWRIGYRSIGSIQLSLAFILLISLPLWKKVAKQKGHVQGVSDTEEKSSEKAPPYKTSNALIAAALFLFYCGTEISVGLWGSSYLIAQKDLVIDQAALIIAMYYGGITIGRMVSGFVSMKLSNKQLVTIGIILTVSGLVLMLLPLKGMLMVVPLVMMGAGLAPIFPTMIHETPRIFGAKHGQKVISYEMAAAYLGNAAIPPVIGLIIAGVSMSLFPILLLISLAVVVLAVVKLYRIKA